jgi:hypothetical protein
MWAKLIFFRVELGSELLFTRKWTAEFYRRQGMILNRRCLLRAQKSPAPWLSLPYVQVSSQQGLQITLYCYTSQCFDWMLFNKNKNQLDATNNSVYWSSRSAQHVSDKTMSIIRSVRLQITACGMPVRHPPSHQAHSTTLPPSWPPTRHYNRTPYHML